MCNREQDVLDAVASGRLEELREHLGSCSDCADLALVAAAFQTEEVEAANLPSASFLWWKSKLRARRESEAKAIQPVLVAEKIALGAGAAALAGIGWWLWPSASFLLNSTLALGTGVAVVSLMGFAVYAVLAKE
jgi:bacterioferritin-associated ferredoxin